MEIEILTAQVKKQVLTITTSHTFVTDTQNIYTASFSFDEEWDGFAKTVIFRSKNHIRFALLDGSNKCMIPADVIEAERLEIGVQGNKDGQVITTKRADKVKVFESGGSINMVPAPFEQSEFDKLMDELARVQKIAEQSIADAEQSHVDAEQVAADKTEVANNKAVVLQKATEVANNTTAAKNAATTATAQAAISQNLYDQLQPMNVDVSSKAPSIISEAAGSVITLDDSSNMPLQSLTIYGRSTQDGTPTPEAPVEIVSVENPKLSIFGKNLLNKPDIFLDGAIDLGMFYLNFRGPIGSYVLGTDITKYPNDTERNTRITFEIMARDGSTLKNSSQFDSNNVERDGVKQHKKVELSVLKPVSALRGWLLDGSTGTSSRYVKAENNIVSINPKDDKFYPYIPEQSLTFPYTLRGIPVSSGGNYTDESGQQWVCDTLEVNADETGKLVQRVEYISIKEYVDKYEWAVYSNLIYKIYTINDNDIAKSYGDDKTDGLMSTTIPIVAFSKTDEIPTTLKSVSISFRRSSERGLCATFLEKKTDITEAKESLKTIGGDGGYIQYILATPIETALTTEEVQAFLALHTNKPYSTIFNSAGADQKIEYVADTKKYIDNKFTELQNAILSTGGNV